MNAGQDSVAVLRVLRNLREQYPADAKVLDDYIARLHQGIASLQAQGGAVAWISPNALAALAKCRDDEHNGCVDAWMQPTATYSIPVYATPSAPVGVVQDLRQLADEVMHESVEEESHGWRSLPAMRVCYFVRQLRTIAARLAAAIPPPTTPGVDA